MKLARSQNARMIATTRIVPARRPKSDMRPSLRSSGDFLLRAYVVAAARGAEDARKREPLAAPRDPRSGAMRTRPSAGNTAPGDHRSERTPRDPSNGVIAR